MSTEKEHLATVFLTALCARVLSRWQLPLVGNLQPIKSRSVGLKVWRNLQRKAAEKRRQGQKKRAEKRSQCEEPFSFKASDRWFSIDAFILLFLNSACHLFPFFNRKKSVKQSKSSHSSFLDSKLWKSRSQSPHHSYIKWKTRNFCSELWTLSFIKHQAFTFWQTDTSVLLVPSHTIRKRLSTFDIKGWTLLQMCIFLFCWKRFKTCAKIRHHIIHWEDCVWGDC